MGANENRKYFEAWFEKVLADLYGNRDAGFAILLIVFPLLERYLRGKTGLTLKKNLSEPFYKELVQFLPDLGTSETARSFWQTYRNGLLHQVTLPGKTPIGTGLPVRSISHDGPLLKIEPNGDMCVNVVQFAQRVVTKIGKDFATYEGCPAWPSRLPTVKHLAGNTPILGTNTAD